MGHSNVNGVEYEVFHKMSDTGNLASMVAYYSPDDDRLAITRHADGHVTIRIGKGGHGPRKDLSPAAAQALAAMLAPTPEEVA